MQVIAFLAVVGFLWQEMWDLIRDHRYRSVLVWMLVLLSVGVFYYRLVEGWSVVDSLYFCVMTLATVGFGDLVPTTPGSKLFTIAYVIMGLSFFLSFVSLLTRDRRRMVFPEKGVPPHDVADG